MQQTGRRFGQDYSIFPTVSPAKKSYLAERVAGREVPVSKRGEAMFTMISGLAVFAAFCVAALLWLG